MARSRFPIDFLIQLYQELTTCRLQVARSRFPNAFLIKLYYERTTFRLQVARSRFPMDFLPTGASFGQNTFRLDVARSRFPFLLTLYYGPRGILYVVPPNVHGFLIAASRGYNPDPAFAGNLLNPISVAKEVGLVLDSP